MFCPNCRAEYVENVTECPDCHVSLVADLPETPAPEFTDYVEIVSTFNPVDIAMIKSLLEGQEIDFYLHGEYFNLAGPLVQPARLMVRKDQVEEVKEILKGLQIKYMIALRGEATDSSTEAH